MAEIQGTQTGPDSYSPLVTVLLDIEGSKAQVPALIDSGADLTIIPAELLEGHPSVFYPNLPILPGLATGAGGSFEVRVCPGSGIWRGVKFCDELQVAKPGALETPLLGIGDFFKQFIVRFNWNRNPPSFKIDPVGKDKKGKQRF